MRNGVNKKILSFILGLMFVFGVSSVVFDGAKAMVLADDGSWLKPNYNKDFKWGYTDNNGTVVIPFTFDEAWSFYEGLARVEKDGKWGFINTHGTVVIPYQFDDALGFYEGLAAVEKDGKWGFIDNNGTVIIPYQFDNTKLFSEGLASVQKNGEYGFINQNGTVVIPYQFDWAGDFSEGLACVEKDGKYGFINISDELVIPYQFNGIGYFRDGVTSIIKDCIEVYINKKGEIFTDESEAFKSAQALSNGETYTSKYGNDTVTIKLPSNVNTSNYNINIVTPTLFDANLYDSLISYNKINDDLIKETLLEIKITDNDKDIYKFDNSINLTFNLSNIDFKNIDTSKLICIFIDEDTNELEYLGGSYDANKKAFITETKNVNGEFAVVYADISYYNQAVLKPNDNNFLSNGNVKTLDSAPVVQNGTTYVPVRAIFETLGANVSFENTTKTAIISLDGKTVKFRTGESIDGAPAPIIINSRMLVPIRYVSETIGANVIWYPEDKVIQITK